MNTFDIVNLKPSWFGISFLSHLIFHVKMNDFFYVGWNQREKLSKNSFTCNIYQNSKKCRNHLKWQFSIFSRFLSLS